MPLYAKQPSKTPEEEVVEVFYVKFHASNWHLLVFFQCKLNKDFFLFCGMCHGKNDLIFYLRIIVSFCFYLIALTNLAYNSFIH